MSRPSHRAARVSHQETTTPQAIEELVEESHVALGVISTKRQRVHETPKAPAPEEVVVEPPPPPVVPKRAQPTLIKPTVAAQAPVRDTQGVTRESIIAMFTATYERRKKRESDAMKEQYRVYTAISVYAK